MRRVGIAIDGKPLKSRDAKVLPARFSDLMIRISPVVNGGNVSLIGGNKMRRGPRRISARAKYVRLIGISLTRSTVA
jgi:hypothetical protein